jgi:hypothetical protein
MFIKNSQITNKSFIEGLSSLMTLKMPAKQCLEVSSCIDDLMGQYQIIGRAKRAIADKYCTKDDTGKPISNAEGNLVFETPELQDICTAELKEIDEEGIDLALSGKIKIDSRESMTPLQVKVLGDIITIVDNN